MGLRVAYILHIFPKLSETFIAGELAELKRRGVEFRIFSLLPPRDEPQHEIIARSGLDQRVCYDVARFVTELRAFKPDILHAHFATEATAMARSLAAELGVPYTFTAHGYDIFRKPPADFAARAGSAAAVVTVSESNAQYMIRAFDLKREHINIIPCGMDTDRFTPATQPPAGPPLLLCVARLVKVKNLGLLLDACARLRADALNFRCVLVGDGVCREELEARVQQLELGGIVEFAGAARQDTVLEWWRQARLGTLTSEREGMPVSLMEAASCGVPVVAPRVGGIPELVEDGVTGLLVPPNDAAALATAYKRLLTDETLARRLGQNARVRATRSFSVQRKVGQLLAMWSAICRKEVPA